MVTENLLDGFRQRAGSTLFPGRFGIGACTNPYLASLKFEENNYRTADKKGEE